MNALFFFASFESNNINWSESSDMISSIIVSQLRNCRMRTNKGKLTYNQLSSRLGLSISEITQADNTLNFALALISRVDADRYQEIRARILDAFMIDDYPDFNEFLEGNDFELGDISNLIGGYIKAYSSQHNGDSVIPDDIFDEWSSKFLQDLDRFAREM